jgi:uncharacterized membrane protein YqiK
VNFCTSNIKKIGFVMRGKHFVINIHVKIKYKSVNVISINFRVLNVTAS